MYTLRRSLLYTSLPRNSHLLERERETRAFIHSSIYPIPSRYIAGSDLQAPSHSVALAKKKASKRVHELHPTCNYMYMYMYFTTIPLPTCTVQPWASSYLPAGSVGSVHVQYMNCHRQYNWKSLTCLLSGTYSDGLCFSS